MKGSKNKCRITGISLEWYGRFDTNENNDMCGYAKDRENLYVRKYKSLLNIIRKNKIKEKKNDHI